MNITSILVTAWFVVSSVYTFNGLIRWLKKVVLKQKPKSETVKAKSENI